MEDDDEFGDLYTDVLRPLSAASQSHQTPAAPSPLHRPIDLNINLKSDAHRDSPLRPPVSQPNSTPPRSFPAPPRLSTAHAPPRADDKHGEFVDNDVKFDIEEGNIGISNEDVLEIPGISLDDSVVENEVKRQNDGIAGGEDEDWESDSEDDLQIVLNDESQRPMVIDDGDDDEDDEDGDPLVIVADADASNLNHQGLMMEEQDWGGGDEVTGQTGEGGGVEKKEAAAGERANTGAAVAANAAKIGYSNHYAYHNPYHSQFKVSVICV